MTDGSQSGDSENTAPAPTAPTASTVPNLPTAPTAVAVAMVGLLVVVPSIGAPESVAIGIAATVGVVALGWSLVRTGAPLPALAWFLGSFLAVGGLAVGVWLAGEPLWLAALGGVAVAALLSYGLHRYELVKLGLVGSERP